MKVIFIVCRMSCSYIQKFPIQDREIYWKTDSIHKVLAIISNHDITDSLEFIVCVSLCLVD